MEYICLVLQIIFFIVTFFLPTNDRFLVEFNHIYKKYLVVESIVQGLCLICNIVLIFIMKEIMLYILVLHIFLMVCVLILYSWKAKKLYFKELTDIILENDLSSMDAKKIKHFLLEKYEKIYFLEDIEKCLNSIENKNPR